MGMTREEKITKDYLQTLLAEQGYVTYSDIFSNFDLNLTDNPKIIGFMEPSKGRIVINRNITDENTISVIIRHEILHFFLEHEQRMVRKISKKMGLNPDNLSLKELENVKHEIYKNKKFNIAGDYEISNRGYTDEDKDVIRNIELNGKILSGLVTEDKHPDWVDMPLEDMYDQLNKNNEEPEKPDKPNKPKKPNFPQDPDDGDDGDNGGGGEGGDGGDGGDGGGGGGGYITDNTNDTDNEGDSGQDGSSDDSNDFDDSDTSDGDGDSDQDSSDSDDGSSGGNGKSSKKHIDRSKKSKDETDTEETPQIGDTGDEDELAKEDELRQKQIEDERSEYGDEDDEDDGLVDAETREQNRLDKIRRILQDKDVAQQIQDETETQVSSSRSRTTAQNAKKYRNSPIKKFEASLDSLIKSQVGNKRGKSWKKFNPTKSAAGLLGPGNTTIRKKNVPLINVYFDRSASWDSEKTAIGEQAIGTLNNYVRKKLIKIDLYYFANTVSDRDDSRIIGWGTAGQPILDHIKQTHPDNVIVMTDSDIDDCSSSVTVPGAVWFLWKGGISTNLQQHLKGDADTQNYNLD